MKKKIISIAQKILPHTPLKKIYEEGLIRELRLLLINWVFQRVFGINGNVPWSVHFTSRVTNPNKIILGTGVKKSFAVSPGCYIQGGNGIIIMDDTIFAPGTKIISANHNINRDSREWVQSNPITIGKRCWIGANAIVLPGVTLGDNVIVGAGAVVTHSFPGYTVLAGVPAKVIRVIN